MIQLFNKWLKKSLDRRHFNPSLRYFLQNLVAISLQVLLIFMALQIAGIQLTFFTAIVAGLSVAAGLALSGTLQNFVSGILILVLRPYSVGDNVVMQGQEGTVTSITIVFIPSFSHLTTKPLLFQRTIIQQCDNQPEPPGKAKIGYKP